MAEKPLSTNASDVVFDAAAKEGDGDSMENGKEPSNVASFMKAAVETVPQLCVLVVDTCDRQIQKLTQSIANLVYIDTPITVTSTKTLKEARTALSGSGSISTFLVAIMRIDMPKADGDQAETVEVERTGLKTDMTLTSASSAAAAAATAVVVDQAKIKKCHQDVTDTAAVAAAESSTPCLCRYVRETLKNDAISLVLSGTDDSFVFSPAVASADEGR